METFTPEFAAFWRSEAEESALRATESRESTPSLSPSQQSALEELAERVTAARSVI
ncbi:MAG TPA: hypothetical protein VL742_16865 [Casimicrobiaceae bacterium]|nr:hypothetical protein [Casimicrobiaceae bacterium]